MTRLLRLQSRLLKEIDKYEKLVPQARGVDPELASCACAVHDYGRIITGKQKDHAEAGYLPVKGFLRDTGLFTEEEIETIALAVKNHSRKSEIGTPIEEIAKDTDVIDFYQYGFCFDREDQRLRYERMLDSEGKVRL